MEPDTPEWELKGDRDALARWVAADHPSAELEADTRAWVARMKDRLPTTVKSRKVWHRNLGEVFEGVIFELDDREFTVRITYWVNAKAKRIMCGPIKSVRIPVSEPGDREDSTCRPTSHAFAGCPALPPLDQDHIDQGIGERGSWWQRSMSYWTQRPPSARG